MDRHSGRATSLAQMQKQLKGFISAEGYKQGLAFEPRSSDVIITPFGKSGTTWTQQIVHTLRTRGDMDFDDISRVVPWIETSGDLGIDLDAEQRAEPRAFKSHLSADLVPKGGRYINVVRDPGDAAVSLFKFNEGWFLEPGAVSVDEFVQAQLTRDEGYFKHLLSWWPRRNDPDVLFLAYEHMLADPVLAIRRIAEFIGIALDSELLAITLEHSSLAFMLKHKDRFDDALMRRRSEEVAGIPPGSDSAKVRAGQSGSAFVLSDQTQRMLKQAWHKHISPVLGFASYAELLDALRSQQPARQ